MQISMLKNLFQRINIPKLPVLTTEQAMKNIKDNLDHLNEWKNIVELIPEDYLNNLNKRKTGISGVFSASLELSKEGIIEITQKKLFDKVMIKKINE